MRRQFTRELRQTPHDVIPELGLQQTCLLLATAHPGSLPEHHQEDSEKKAFKHLSSNLAKFLLPALWKRYRINSRFQAIGLDAPKSGMTG